MHKSWMYNMYSTQLLWKMYIFIQVYEPRKMYKYVSLISFSPVPVTSRIHTDKMIKDITDIYTICEHHGMRNMNFWKLTNFLFCFDLVLFLDIKALRKTWFRQ